MGTGIQLESAMPIVNLLSPNLTESLQYAVKLYRVYIKITMLDREFLEWGKADYRGCCCGIASMMTKNKKVTPNPTQRISLICLL